MSKSILNNLLAKGTLSVFNILVPFLIIPYVYRVLSPDTVGNIEYGTTLYTYFSLLGLLGIYNYGLREVSRNKNDNDKIKSIYKNLFFIGFVSNLFFFILFEILVFLYVDENQLRYIMYVLGFNLIAQIFYIEWINEAFEDFKFITVKTVIIRLFSVVAIILLVRWSDDYLFYVAIVVGTLLFNNVISFVRAQSRVKTNIFKNFDYADIKTYLIPLILILFLNNTNVLYTMADRTMLGLYSETKEVAYYSVGQKVAESIKILLLSIIYVTLPRLSLYLETNKELYIRNIQKIIRLMLLLILPVALGLFMLSEQIVILFAGRQYLDAVPCFRIFALRIVVLSIESILYNQIIFLHRKEKVLLVLNLCCGVLSVGLNFVFLNHLTPLIAISTTLFCEIIFQILCLIYIKKKLLISTYVFDKKNLIYLELSLLFVPIILILKYFFIENQYLFVILSIMFCAFIYIGGLYLKKDELFMESIKRVYLKH